MHTVHPICTYGSCCMHPAALPACGAGKAGHTKKPPLLDDVCRFGGNLGNLGSPDTALEAVGPVLETLLSSLTQVT